MAKKLASALDNKVQDLESTYNAVYEGYKEREEAITAALARLSKSLACPASDSNLPAPLRLSEEGFCEEDDDFEDFSIALKKSRFAKGVASECVRLQETWKIVIFGSIYLGYQVQNVSDRIISNVDLLITDLGNSGFDYIYETYALSADGVPLHVCSIPQERCVNPSDRGVLFKDFLSSKGLEKKDGKWTLGPGLKCVFVARISLPSFAHSPDVTYVSLLNATIPEKLGKKSCPLQIPLAPLHISVKEVLKQSPSRTLPRNRLLPSLYLHPVSRSFITSQDSKEVHVILQETLGFEELWSGEYSAHEGALAGIFICKQIGTAWTLLDCYCRNENQLTTFLALFRLTANDTLQDWSDVCPRTNVSLPAAKQAFLRELDFAISFLEKQAKSENSNFPSLVKKESGKFGTDASAERELRDSLKRLEVRENENLKCPKGDFGEFLDKFTELQDETNKILSE